ncbi:MAG: hypothetical protein RL571_2899 [Pseudomonadota bacterium]|jgi:hypothetical protein
MDQQQSKAIQRYRQKMHDAGFIRLGAMVSAELSALLIKERRPNECTGRVLERLILGESAPRPKS